MTSTLGVKEFYAGSTVLVTGGTGFLGKAIIEKLLRTCKDIGLVYTLLRSKTDTNSDCRFEKLKANHVYREGHEVLIFLQKILLI